MEPCDTCDGTGTVIDLTTTPPEPVAGRQIVIIVDIDGTLAIMKDRGAYEWGKVGNDELNQPVAQAVSALRNMGNTVILLSGRDGSCRKETEQSL